MVDAPQLTPYLELDKDNQELLKWIKGGEQTFLGSTELFSITIHHESVNAILNTDCDCNACTQIRYYVLIHWISPEFYREGECLGALAQGTFEVDGKHYYLHPEIKGTAEITEDTNALYISINNLLRSDICSNQSIEI